MVPHKITRDHCISVLVVRFSWYCGVVELFVTRVCGFFVDFNRLGCVLVDVGRSYAAVAAGWRP